MSRVLMSGLDDGLGTWLERRLGGVPVQAARSGQETLEALAVGDWALLILNDSGTRISATDVLSRVRTDLGLTQLPVVYCLERGLDSDLLGRLVDQLGVSQLLFHPLDREELARQAATILGLALPPERDEGPAKQTIMAVAGLWEEFKADIAAGVGMVEEARTALHKGTLSDELRRKARAEAHKLTGSVGTAGFVKASRLAREMERILQDRATLGEAQAVQLSELTAAFRQELDQAPVEQAAERVPVDDRPLVLVVDDDLNLARRLATEATALGMRADLATSPSAARQAIARECPDVVLLDLSFPDGTEDGLILLAELTDRTPPVPALVLTVRDTLVDRVEVARRGGRGFLSKSVPPSQVLEAVTQLLHRLRPDEAKMMVVDDDPHVLAALRSLVEPARIRLTTLDDPLRFWETLEEVSPDLLVLDVEMPHLSGIEICRVVRNDPRWSGLPTLFLTARTDADTVHRLFAAGADDFVSKPIVGPELLTRILNRLERTKLLRMLAETDPLTGVANRRKSTQSLGQLLRLASRHSQPLSLALMDLDHFKQVNDHYGHPAGDAVLRRLGELLLRFFRGDDVVSRWGGEEFVVGMYGMTRDDGVRRLTEVLRMLRQEEFDGPDAARFRVTFSAGVAAYPVDGADLQILYRAADQALYRAKAAGRGRVLPTGSDPDGVGGSSRSDGPAS